MPKDLDRVGRFLFIDVYSLDLGGKPNWPALAVASDETNEYVGAILKATEGTSFDTSWFRRNWPIVKAIGEDRYGIDWFRGAYHFLRFYSNGEAQADFYLRTIEMAGGWDGGDVLPIVDVELGKPGSSNYSASAQMIIDCTSKFAERIKAATGRRVILYGRGAMRDKSIVHRMSCDLVWNPSYTKSMVTNGLVPPWALEDISLWQYCGDGVGSLPDYPLEVPNFGKVDISVFIDGANKPTLARLRERLL